jgi:hypothetical protein
MEFGEMELLPVVAAVEAFFPFPLGPNSSFNSALRC